jgi:hypothetical protein
LTRIRRRAWVGEGGVHYRRRYAPPVWLQFRHSRASTSRVPPPRGWGSDRLRRLTA